MRILREISAVLAVSLLFSGSPAAQDEAAGGVDAAPKSLDTLRSLAESIALLEDQIDARRDALEKAETETEREQISNEINDLLGEQDEARSDFESIASGVDMKGFQAAQEKHAFSLRNEVEELLQPLVEELQDLTEKPRRQDKMRGDLEVEEARELAARGALGNVNALLENTEAESPLYQKLEASRKQWQDRLTQSRNRIQVLEYQLEKERKERRSVFTAASEGFRAFFRSRGRNFMLTVLAFLGVFFGIRFLHNRFHQINPWRRRGERSFSLRLFDVVAYAFTLLGAIAAAVIVLYATGDWLLLGLAIVILASLALAAKNALPRYYEQARLLMNLGEVREGERVIYGGVPWRVEKVSLFTIFKNEALRGGELRLPIRHLNGLLSRPTGEGEPWFPCQEGQWVELADGTRGRVVLQTPETVQLVKLGGTRVSYRADDFLGQAPRILSTDFRIRTVFGIDYRYQEIATTVVPDRLWTHLTRELCAAIGGHEKLKSLKVEFESAGASALNYEIIADLEGELASRKEALTRGLQKWAVDCCNENGWVIPFTQITLHQAGAANGDPPAAKEGKKQKGEDGKRCKRHGETAAETRNLQAADTEDGVKESVTN